ncbi:iron complex transport system substrate-binding protein [Fontimonas thermophila]|uniref:Iron complex transport system substrate-binding protein n=1 Tax=Fontimonas thermophila TaxID=1076937 RepID=A0A1I2K4B3_9GAMM|nr:helical backbone metal receptor [Fontimonas thermophila]SFF61169.1 iron complex transport system substrate-binding protein [Fontimonas thermophila]
MSVRVVSHTCSNTEIVCALGCADRLVAIDSDSDFPPEIVAGLPKLGRDLDIDVGAVAALRPDLVLTSLTVPGHERIVTTLQALGLPCLVIDPQSLDDVFASIRTIAGALGVPERGERLVREMDAAMPALSVPADAPPLLVEWWPKPVIGAARRSWVHDLIERAGGRNALAAFDAKSVTVDTDALAAVAPNAIVMSWCGVRPEKYRAEVVLRRAGWQDVPAVRHGRVYGVSEAFLGRPGPRLVEGYRALRRIVVTVLAEDAARRRAG